MTSLGTLPLSAHGGSMSIVPIVLVAGLLSVAALPVHAELRSAGAAGPFVAAQEQPARAPLEDARTQQAELPPGVIPHAEWERAPSLGHAADANRRNLRPGDSLVFRDLEISIVSTDVDSASPAAPIDVARVRLARGDIHDDRTVREGDAFNWEGYHIAIVAVYGPGELGAGLTAVEVATISSLPAHIARSPIAGGADLRLRIPHRITHVTLHHTGSAEPLRPEDDPVQKLRGLQSWGATDRNWWDVPYHFLIDLDGRVYEGRDWRYMGETNTTYDPAGHFLISVIGNYGRQQASQAQLDAIAGLMAWAIARFDLPLDRIGGHYNYAETTCPGEHLRRYLEDGTLRRMVTARLAVDGPDTAGASADRRVNAASVPSATAQRPYTAADVRFMQRMIAHHVQAVVMTDMVATRAENPAIRLIARRIDVSQKDEMRLMRRWLEVRGEHVPDSMLHEQHQQHEQHREREQHHQNERREWHRDSEHDTMPGMLAPEELERLERSTGAEFDGLFLEYMIRHHEGALVMVAELFATPGAGREPELYQFASHVDADQRAEIARMRRMQASPDRGSRQ